LFDSLGQRQLLLERSSASSCSGSDAAGDATAVADLA
jgi:hypothetical protein